MVVVCPLTIDDSPINVEFGGTEFSGTVVLVMIELVDVVVRLGFVVECC